jgi:serine/threonine protein kinase
MPLHEHNVKDLFTSKQADSLSLEKRLDLALETACAIRDIHGNDIVHGDIKADNFMYNIVGDTMTIFAVDFGATMKLPPGQDHILRSGGVFTPKYAAPEVLPASYVTQKGKDNRQYLQERFPPKNGVRPSEIQSYSQASDVFALGITWATDFKLLAENSPLSELIQRMTDLDPSKRPTMDQVVAECMVAAKKEVKDTQKKAAPPQKNSEIKLCDLPWVVSVIKKYGFWD